MKLKKRKNKKKSISNNTKKLLILTLLASSCIDASEYTDLADEKVKNVLKNTISLATKLHPKEELNKLYEFLTDELKNHKYDEKYITVEQAFVLSILTIDRHKLENFFGFKKFSIGELGSFTSKEVTIWLSFLNKLDAFCNTKPYVSKIDPKVITIIERRKINKKKKTRTHSQSNKIASKTAKLSKGKQKYIEKKEKVRSVLNNLKILAFKTKVDKFVENDDDNFFISYEPPLNTDNIIYIQDSINGLDYWLWFLKEDVRYSCDWKLITSKRYIETQEVLQEISNEIKELW